MQPSFQPQFIVHPCKIVTSAIGMVLLLAGGVANGALVAHWAFDEGTGASTADLSGNGKTGVFIGGTTWGSDAIRASYGVFNGTDSAVNPGLVLPAFSGTNDFTWAFWANSQAVADASQQNAVIVGNRYSGADNVEFSPRQFIKFTPTQFEWHQNANGNDNLNVDDLAVGEWHHHAIVKTGTLLEYYRDGSLMTSRSLNEPIGSAAHPFFIGGAPGSGSVNEFFNGYIDDVRLFDNALSAQEVSGLVPEPSVALLGVCGLATMLVRRRDGRRSDR